MKNSRIILAGGSGQRMGDKLPKQFLPLAEQTILGKIIILFLFVWISPITGFSQRTFEYKTSLSGSVSVKENLPMWATTHKYGILPDSRGGLLQAGIFSDFNSQKKFQVAYGFSAAGYLTQHKNNILIDELYFSMKWEKIRLDLGMIHPEEEFNGISAQNGNMLFSANARTLPGYNLKTDYIKIPLTGEILSFKLNWGDYLMTDDRFVDKPRLHNKSLYLRISPCSKLDISVGLEHWVQWAGDSPLYGKQPDSFRDYVKIFCARGGGEDATLSDSLNALGNHLGREHIRINYKASHYTLSFYHDIPFEDGSGTRFANFPDGSWGLYYGSKNSRQWISDIIYELIYTKSQSGAHHDRPATEEEKATQDPRSPFYGRVVLGGNDNYFNNGEYQSGWTCYGRTIGTPFVTPHAPDARGITLGVFNNRVIAHYLGIKGYFMEKLPYQLRLSYSFNYGTYNTPLENTPKQFSFGLEAGILRNPKAPFHIDLGIYGDYGKLYPQNLGVTISLSRNGTMK